MLTLGVESLSLIFGLLSEFSGGRESFHWHGVVVEFIVSWCTTENGCVHVSNLPMQVAYPANTSIFSATFVH